MSSRRALFLPWLMAAFALPAGAAPDVGAAPDAGVTTATPGNLPAPTTPQQKSALLQMQEAFTAIAQTVEPTVVNIKAERLRPADGADSASRPGIPGLTPAPHRLEATGSGVIVRADGYILTNDHVVEGAGGTVTVTLADGREFPGKVYPDFNSDLAVIKIDPGATPLPVAGFADGTTVRPGQWAIAVGSPFDLQNTVTVGVISAVGRHQSISGQSISGEASARYYPDLIQTDAAINPGNSGGPLFNMDGKVVGINVAIESPVEGSAGVGFAIPSDIVQTIMASLIRSGRVTRGYLGVAPEDLTPAMQAQYGQKDGAFVRDVLLDSPAGRAGLQAGDIVTAYDGKAVHGEVGLRETISATAPGRLVSLAYVRDGRPGTASVTVGTPLVLPSGEPVPPIAAPPAGAAKLGLTVRTLVAADRVSMGLPPATVGVVITAVTPGSPAESAGLLSGVPSLTGTVLERLGGQAVRTKAEYDRAAAALASGSSTTLILLYSANSQVHQTAVPVSL